MRNLLKNKKVFFVLIIAVCVGLFCGAKGLQNYYFNQSTDSPKKTVENTKKLGNRNKEKDVLQKNEVADSNEKSNTIGTENKSDNNKVNTGSTTNNPAPKSIQPVKSNNNSSNYANSNSNTGGTATHSEVNFKIIDEVHGKTLAQAYIDMDDKTVEDITVTFLRDNKIHFYNSSTPLGGYMAMMYDLKAKGDSGWCFWVNNVKSTIGESDKKLNKGDTVVWKFLENGL